MDLLKVQGKIRSVGFSFHLYSGTWVDNNMVEEK